ncbi:MAG: ERCC4 domain-containing protein [Caldisphaera sp.]|jgi:DNA excision repair protein ERCC-4|uniref:ERCC4 domain-containing protein n=1 Tax=Caldisphaera sp. TaxID=2060322 RepID=UPI00397D764F
MEAKKYRVYADSREETSGVPKLLESMGIMVIRRQLEEGDYMIPEGIIIERKSAPDFVKSLFDGRLFEQAKRMLAKYQNIIYIVEGDFKKSLLYYRNREKQIQAALVTLIMEFNAKVLWSLDQLSTAEYIESIVRKSFLNKENNESVIHKKPKLDENRQWQLYILQSFPGIGEKNAEKLLDHFGSLEKFFNASLSELASIIGEKKASKIKELIKIPYKKGSKEYSSLENYYDDKG